MPMTFSKCAEENWARKWIIFNMNKLQRSISRAMQVNLPHIDSTKNGLQNPFDLSKNSHTQGRLLTKPNLLSKMNLQ